MLNGHPQISWLNEFEYSVDRLTDPKYWPEKEVYYKYLSTHRVFQASNLKIDKKLDYPSLIASFLKQRMKHDNKPIVGATCHKHYNRLIRLFPNCKFIYILRDPRDVSRSNIGMGWAGNVWKGVDKWIEAENLWNNTKLNLSKNRYIEVTFENLITKPEETLNYICEFIGVQYNTKMLSYPNSTTYSSPDPKLTYQWKLKLKPEEIQLVESKAHNIMHRRGYIINSSNLKQPTYSKKIVLVVHDKLFRILYRIKTYGFILVIKYFFARRLGFKGLERQLTIKFNEKTQKITK